jgi:5-methylcytosine-specific restriction endonuclease McrA
MIKAPMGKIRNSKKRVVKKRLYRDQNGLCYYCRELFPPIEMTFDHVVPRSRGGTNQNTNLVLACAPCNSVKADTLQFPAASHHN